MNNINTHATLVKALHPPREQLNLHSSQTGKKEHDDDNSRRSIQD